MRVCEHAQGNRIEYCAYWATRHWDIGRPLYREFYSCFLKFSIRICERLCVLNNWIVYVLTFNLRQTFLSRFICRLGRRMIYYVSVLILLGGRIATIFTAPWYTMFIIAATFGSLTANSIFQSPLIIALETSKP